MVPKWMQDKISQICGLPTQCQHGHNEASTHKIKIGVLKKEKNNNMDESIDEAIDDDRKMKTNKTKDKINDTKEELRL